MGRRSQGLTLSQLCGFWSSWGCGQEECVDVYLFLSVTAGMDLVETEGKWLIVIQFLWGGGLSLPCVYREHWWQLGRPYRCKWSEIKSLSRVQLFATPWTVARQAPLSMGFSRQEYWSRLSFPSPGDLPYPGIEPGCPALQADALSSEPPGKPSTDASNR